MSKGINKVILIGNIGKDPETRFLPNGKAVTNLSIATSESWTDKASGEKKQATEWHRIVFFDRLAEIAGQYARKGAKIYVEGKLKTKKWTDQQGIVRYSTDIHCSELQLLSNRQDDASQVSEQQDDVNQVPPERRQPAHTQEQSARYHYIPLDDDGQQQQQQIQEMFDDDIPF